MADENKKNLDEIKKANTAKKEGIELNKETKKELLSQREALNELLKLQKAGLETRRETLGLSRDLAKFAAEEVIAHEKSDKFIRSEADIAEAMLKNEQLREELKQKVIDSGGEISKNLQSQLDTTEDITAQLQEQFNKRDLINEKIGKYSTGPLNTKPGPHTGYWIQPSIKKFLHIKENNSKEDQRQRMGKDGNPLEQIKHSKNSIIKKRIKQLQKNKKLWKSISIKQN